MTIELTNDEKISMIEQHIKSIEYSIYGSQLDLLEANAVVNKDTELISNINDRISVANQKKAALVAEKDSLTA
jgi:hypothetical protein